MTQDIYVMSLRAADFAQEVREFLHQRFDIAMCVRSVQRNSGYRIYPVCQPKNRHLVDVHFVDPLPPSQRVVGILVLTPVELISTKIISILNRPKTAKGLIDEADLRRLLLAFPDLKTETGPVSDRLKLAISQSAEPGVLRAWERLVGQEILPEDEFGA